jgi:2-oxoglutarate ferredoxin oxidoreductase subunit delta
VTGRRGGPGERRSVPDGVARAGTSTARRPGEVLTRGTVVIDRERCKGCDLCIAACPPEVLVMSTDVNTIGYRYPQLLPGCTGCRACHAVCPDFVFDVYKFVEPVWLATGSADGTEGAT